MTKLNRVLLVENDTTSAMMMTDLLSRERFHVETALTGQKGMELATTRKFDLILLNTDLPEISGFDICLELKRRHISCQTPIILLSDDNLKERREEALELGADDFIEKPFHPTELLQIVTLHARLESQYQSESKFQDAGPTERTITQMAFAHEE